MPSDERTCECNEAGFAHSACITRGCQGTPTDAPRASVEGSDEPWAMYAVKVIASEISDAIAAHESGESVDSTVRAKYVVAAITPARPAEGGEAVAALEAKKYPPPLAYDQSIWNAAMNTAIEIVKSAPPAPQVTEPMVAPLIEALHGMGYPAIRHADARVALAAALRGGAR